MQRSASASDPSRLLALALGLGLALGGCAWLPAPARNFGEKVRAEWGALLAVLQGGRSPLAARPERPAARPVLDAEAQARNAEIVQEMFKVVHLRDTQNPNEIVDWVEALNEGASVEGLYRGLTRSTLYRKLEVDRGPARAGTVENFVREVLRLEDALGERIPLEAPGVRPSPVPGQTRVQELSVLYAGVSAFTLKRVLGEAGVHCVATQKLRGKLAPWYGAWASALGREKVADFGLALRNKDDEGFHRAWAETAPEDRVLWEVLNRLNRILNETERNP